MNRGNKAGAIIPSNIPKWRGSFEDFENPNGKLYMFAIPEAFVFTKGNMPDERKDELRDMLAWAMVSDLIEGFSEIDDQLLEMLIIPVELTEKGKRLVLKGSEGMISAWVAGLTENGIQVKLFGKSEIQGQFYVRGFDLIRPTKDYTKVKAEPGDWCYGVIAEWQNSLPQPILDAIQN